VRIAALAAATFIAITTATLSTAAHAATPPRSNLYCEVFLPGGQITCSSTPLQSREATGATSQVTDTAYLIARLYDNANYDTSAGYLNVYAAGDCTPSASDIDYNMGDLGSWSNRVSSFESFGNCATRLWTGTNYTGSAYPSSSGWLVDSSNVGSAMNDKARSAQFT